VLTWLVDRLARLRPAHQPSAGGNPLLPLEVRLDVVAAVILDGLSYRRAGRMIQISKTEVARAWTLLLGELVALGVCQPDGTFGTSLEELHERLAEMAATGEAVCVDGLAVRVQRPAGWAWLYEVTMLFGGALANAALVYDDGCCSRLLSGPVPVASPCPAVVSRRCPGSPCRR
jgi:hypothetical protein